jgi:hypothetical protein
MESAGVECGSKILGTGLAGSCVALHSPAARTIPANNRNTPTTRPTTTPGSALCNVLFITSQNFTGAALPIAARTTFLLRARLESNSNSMMSHSCPTQRIGQPKSGAYAFRRFRAIWLRKQYLVEGSIRFRLGRARVEIRQKIRVGVRCRFHDSRRTG